MIGDLVQRHLLSDDTSKKILSVIPRLNFVECQGGDSFVPIEKLSLDRNFIFKSQILIHFIE